MRKVLSLLMVALLSTAFLFAGGSNESSDGPVVINHWYWVPNADVARYTEMIDEFNRTHTDVQVNWENVPQDDVRTRFITAFQIGEGPDTFGMGGNWIPEFQAMGMLEPLNDYIDNWDQKDEIIDTLWSQCTIGDTIYGMPWKLLVTYMYYRADWFEEMGIEPPETISEFIDAACKLTGTYVNENGETVDRYGFGLRGGSGNGEGYFIWCLTQGAEFFDEEGNVDDAYGSGDINKNKGLMFQTTTGLAEPYYTQDTSAQRPYADNGGGASYSGQEMLNTIRVEIGTDSTDIYWNGTILFEDYPLTQSDFDSSDGKVYPYFRFIESPSNQYKTNTLTIKGINTPTVEESATTLQRRFDETEPLVLTVDDRDNGDIVFAKSDRTAIDSSLVSYDAEANTLTIQAEAFADVTEAGTYTYLVGNDGGYQPITIVFAEEFEALQSPELSITTYTMVEGQAPEGGLTFTADLKNGEFVSLVGSGLSRSQYTMTLDEATNVATFVISQDFLNNLAIGERTLTLRTQSTDGTETEASAQLVITVTDESGNSGGGNTGDNGGDNGGEATPSGGCSSTVAGAAVGIGGVLLVAAAAVCMFKKRA